VHLSTPRSQATLAPQTGGPTPTCSNATGLARPGGPYTINQVADAYGFAPLYGSGDLGSGVTVGLYELEPFSQSDINAYQQCFGTSATVQVIGSAGSTGAGSGEAALDIENVIGLAPDATIKVYEGTNGGSGPYDLLQSIVDDPTPAQVVSDSWGMCEADLGKPDIEAEEPLFQQAAVEGQTFLAASGDSGATGCGAADPVNPDDPASQQYVTGVGGTTLSAAGPPPTESVWNTLANPGGGASGGGISTVWPMLAYQLNANVPGVINQYSSDAPCGQSTDCREVPDVAADADPNTGYVIAWDNTWAVIGGTSAAAPVWAGLIALADASDTGSCAPRTPLGFLNPNLYSIAAGANAADAFNDIVSGDNNPAGSGDYPATTGYDLATGLGTPIATDGAKPGLVSQLCAAPANAFAPPAVSGLSVRDAPSGAQLTITGTNFSSGATVSFGSIAAAAASVTDPGHITATVPSGSGTVDVTVTTGNGRSATSSSDQFTFGPAAEIETPANGAIYTEGEQVIAAFLCSASTSGTPACTGTSPSGGLIDTAAVGPHQFTVTATDANNVSATQTVDYTVVAPPQVSFTTPVNGSTFYRGEKVAAAFACAATAPVTIAICSAPVPLGGLLNTATRGQWYFTVRAVDANGVVVARTVAYDVVGVRARVSSLSVQRARRGATFSFWLDQPARVTLHFRRSNGSGAGKLTVHRKEGHRAVTDTKLAPGTYTVTVVAIGLSGRTSKVASARFTITKH
jgi:subtilase family serine protease